MDLDCFLKQIFILRNLFTGSYSAVFSLFVYFDTRYNSYLIPFKNLGFLLKIYRLASNLVVSIICCSAAADAVAVDAAARSGDFLDDVTEG